MSGARLAAMQADSQSHLRSNVALDRFFAEKLATPMEYLRRLARQAGVAELDDEVSRQAAGAPAGEAPATGARDRPDAAAAGDAARSVVREVERQLGFAPILDLREADAPGAPRLSEERYSVEGEVGAGGMGKVLNVYDQDLRRRVAMKVLREEVRDARTVSRFFEEAQATGQLEHPNIAPVYDIGMDSRHGIYFTMKLVRGRNLREVLRDIAAGRLETRRHFTLTRLLQILQQVAMGVHFAHARGVIHRDLKPDNIMVGDFGEVFVMDWGLAKIVDRRGDPAAGAPVSSARHAEGHSTQDGTVSGTPCYMAPEQARGWVDEIDERTDIFGLGAILYEILTLHPPYEGDSTREILARAGAGQIAPPHVRAPRANIPAPLEAICLRALAAAKEDRYRTASELHEALQVFLDGTLEAERRRQESAALARQGREGAREYRRLAGEEEKLRRIADEELTGLKPFDAAERKAATWDLEDRAAAARQRRLQAFNEATATLHAALNIDPACDAARETLADLYWQRFEEAERAADLDDQTIYRGLVERYHGGKLARLLEGKGALTLETDPPGAAVTLHRLVEKGRRLQEDEGVACGVTPLKLEIPVGHHLLVLRKAGFRDVRYPLLMTRLGRELAKVNLYRDDEIGAGFVHVPAGDFLMGGDPAASGSLPLCRRYVPDLFVGELPVTFRQYAAFLDALRQADDPELEQCLPRTDKEGECVRPGPDGRYQPALDVIDIDPATSARHAPGFEWHLPVFAVSWYAACRYARWYTETTGRQARLLRDAEWEKAARGVGRAAHPWGDRFDWSFVKGGLSRPERSQPEPVGSFPCDRSIYGVRDLAGTIIEWCEDWFLEGRYRLTRGGGWYSINEAAFRAAFRLGTNPVNRSSLIGFRIAVEPARRR